MSSSTDVFAVTDSANQLFPSDKQPCSVNICVSCFWSTAVKVRNCASEAKPASCSTASADSASFFIACDMSDLVIPALNFPTLTLFWCTVIGQWHQPFAMTSPMSPPSPPTATQRASFFRQRCCVPLSCNASPTNDGPLGEFPLNASADPAAFVSWNLFRARHTYPSVGRAINLR